MTYIEAQQIASDLQDADNKSCWEAFRFLDKSYQESKCAGQWQKCEMPNVHEFGWWVKDMPTSSHPREDGSWCTWYWKQPKDENFVYCITQIRRPIDSSENAKWETIEEVTRKPLCLTDEAQLFFANLNQPQTTNH